MTERWDDLFDRAEAYDVTLEAIRDRLARRRDVGGDAERRGNDA